MGTPKANPIGERVFGKIRRRRTFADCSGNGSLWNRHSHLKAGHVYVGDGTDSNGRIRNQTFCRWKEQFTRLEIDHVRQSKQLQDENCRLKKLVAELTLDRAMLQNVLRKNW